MALTEEANGASLYYNADLGRLEQHIFFLGEDGSLNQSWYDQNVWESQKLPGDPARPACNLRQGRRKRTEWIMRRTSSVIGLLPCVSATTEIRPLLSTAHKHSPAAACTPP